MEYSEEERGRIPADSDGPRTLVAKWLHAGALSKRDIRNSLRGDIMRTGAWTAGRIAVINNAFRLALRRRLGNDAEVKEIAAFVAMVCDHYGPGAIVPIEAEARVRLALGEHLDTSSISPKSSFLISQLFFWWIAMEQGMSESELNMLLVEAERTAIAGGHHAIPSAEEALTGTKPSDIV